MRPGSTCPAIFTLGLLLGCHTALAASQTCETYRKFIPALADRVCGTGGTVKPAAASAGSTFSAAFNINPAAVPTQPSPYGIESINSQIRGATGEISPSFSLIKGFTRFGTAVSTAGNNSFYGNDVLQRSTGSANLSTFNVNELGKAALPHFNLGTAFSLNPSKRGTLSAMKLGVSVRYNSVTSTVGPGLGLAMGEDWLTFGVGFSHEKISNTLPHVTFASAMVGLRLVLIELEYTVLENFGGPSLAPIGIASGTLNLGGAYLTVARRHASYALDGDEEQWHYALQARISKRLAAGVLHNFIPGTNSLALQIFL